MSYLSLIELVHSVQAALAMHCELSKILRTVQTKVPELL